MERTEQTVADQKDGPDMGGVQLYAACRALLAELIDANIKRPES